MNGLPNSQPAANPPPSPRTQWLAALAGLLLILLAGYAGWWTFKAITPGVADVPSSAPAPTAGVPATSLMLLTWQQALADGDWRAANREEDRLVASGNSAVPWLAAEFGDAAMTETTTVRQQRAAATLGRINTQPAVDVLLKVRSPCPDPAVRGQVLLALAQTGPAFESSVEPVLEKTWSDPGETVEIRSSMATLIAKRGQPQAIQMLCNRATVAPGGDTPETAWAITALGFAPAEAGPQVEPVLLKILQGDPDAPHRSLAAEALGHRSGTGVEVALIIAAQMDAAVAVRLAAVQAVGSRTPTNASYKVLRQILQQETDTGVRAAAVQALGRPGAVENLSVLEAALTTQTPAPEPAPVPVYLQLKVVESLERIGGKPAETALQRLLEAAAPAAATQRPGGPAPATETPALILPVVVRGAVEKALTRLQSPQPGEQPPRDGF